ncbi:MAG: rRNA maturation RNase YbeY [Synergistaceae bacterium]|nr:rRNA maturation RNase YbeY [Synergistaceae bacterium]MBQ9574464.1 rRNA maturation RNase YbeY [Synergistaceae bacterium]
MKLSVSIDAPEDSADGNSSSTTNPNYPDIKIYGTEKITGVLEEYLIDIYPESQEYDSAELSMTFMTPEQIRALNNEYRGVDEATDVLSFPMIDVDDVNDSMPLPVLTLGDIVICPEMTFELHPELTQREAMCLMIAHSFLHLLGYDHDTEEREREMWIKQDEIMRGLLEVL